MKNTADVLTAFNRFNGIFEKARGTVLKLFLHSAPQPVTALIRKYLVATDQDRNSGFQTRKPPRPRIVRGRLPEMVDATVDVMGIGGLFAYLNVLYRAHQQPGSYCVATHPHDIFTFSGWTIHPEEDMDQRLIEMFQTHHLVRNELLRLAGLAEAPESLRFKAFKIDYGNAFRLLMKNPAELLKVVEVSLRYVFYEFSDNQQRRAGTNLTRMGETIAALEQMGLIGNDPDKDLVHLCGRIIFEVTGENKIPAKTRLKEKYGLLGTELTPEEVAANYGGKITIMDDIRQGRIRAVLHRGGYFLAGHRDNALGLMRKMGIAVYDGAIVNKIVIDCEAGRHAVTLTTGGGREITIIAKKLLLSLGGYGKGIISVDGISTLFVVRTANEDYRIHPAGMGEGGTIHVVPVWKLESNEDGGRVFYHLGKATDGAIMGRDPGMPKSLAGDQDYLRHLQSHLKRIIPPDGTLLWLAATECGRPVCAEQHYMIRPLLSGVKQPESFEATGGCGLGGNTPVIPEVQAKLQSTHSGQGNK